MDIQIHKKLYTTGMSNRKLATIKKKIRRKLWKLNVFLVTLPIGQQGILEVYWYPELLQSFYQKMNVEVVVVGIAETRAEAFDIIKHIIDDIGVQGGNIPISEFFKE